MEVLEETKIYIEITDEYKDLYGELDLLLTDMSDDYPLIVKLFNALGIVLENAAEKDGII